MSTSSRSVGALSLALLFACCAKRHQYTMHIDMADQSQSLMCSHTDRDGEKPSADGSIAEDFTKCHRLSNEPLASPASLTIKLKNPSKDLRYDLRISQSTREASRAEVTAVLGKFVEHVEAFARTATGGDESTTAAKKLLDQAADVVREKAPEAAASMLTKEDEANDSDKRPPEQRFRGYIDAKDRAFVLADTIRKTAKGGLVVETNSPSQRPPPPRNVDFTDKDLTFLLDNGIGADKVADFVSEWCSADSFVAATMKEQYAALLSGDPASGEVTKALSIGRDDVVQILLGKGDLGVIQKRINALLTEAQTWDKASAAARTYLQMTLGDALAADLEHCNANLVFLESRVPAKKADLEKTADGIVKLTRAATRWSSALVDLFGPLLREATRVVEKTLDLTPGQLATTLSLDPGELEFGVGQTDSDSKHVEVATYKMHVKGVERVAILVGPELTMCRSNCFESVEEIAEQPTDPSMEAKRTLKRTRENRDFALATAVHVTFFPFDDFGLGAILGYPLGAPDETSSNFLVGVGLRHASGVEVALGVHGFKSRVLKEGYPDTIDLSVDGNQGLTADAVTTPRRELGVFVLVAFAPSIFNGK